MLPRISIVTPSYNQGHFLEQTICSVLDQGYPNLDYIVVDGGSRDNSPEIIKKYERHLSYWVSEKDRGQSDAINKGFRRADGNVINWLNSDDYYQPGTLQKVGEAFTDPSVNVYMGTSRIFGPDPDRYSTGTDVYPGNLERTIGMARIDQPETFFRKSCLDEIGYVDEGLHYVMDRELWMRYLWRFGLDGIRKTDDYLVNFRIHGESKTHTSQVKFEAESCGLFRTIAGLTGASFAHAFPEACQPVQLKYANVYSQRPAYGGAVVNYSFFYAFLAAYADNDFAKARSLARIIDKSLLKGDEIGEMQRIRLRLMIPVGIKKLINRFTGKTANG